MTWQEFEEMGRVRMAERYGVPRLAKNAVVLTCGVVVNFDAVADDESVVGDFKSLTANPLYSNVGNSPMFQSASGCSRTCLVPNAAS